MSEPSDGVKEWAACKRQYSSKDKEGLFKKIDLITADIGSRFNRRLKQLADAGGIHNVGVICDYMIAEQTEINIKASTKEGKLKVLLRLSEFHRHRPFEQLTKTDNLAYLNSLRKPAAEDPAQRWVGTYNGRQMIFTKFYRWLFNPDEPDVKRRITPPCMSGVRQLPRKDKSPYKPSDLWNDKEHAVFLKYVPSKRDRAYHAMARDTSCRPHELLNLRVGDLIFKHTEQAQYAEIVVAGKTGQRSLPIIDALPYVRDYLQNEHPFPSNPDAWLFVSLAQESFGKKLRRDGLWDRYARHYKKNYFPKLLKDETVPPADKAILKNLLSKPWALYVQRHGGLTQMSKVLSEASLRNYAGWTQTSKMPAVYLHFYGNEAVDQILQTKGLIRADTNDANLLKRKVCPHCEEPNPQTGQFCIKCRMVLDYASYRKSIEEKQKREDEVKTIRDEMNQKFDRIMKWIQERPELAQVKPEALLAKELETT